LNPLNLIRKVHSWSKRISEFNSSRRDKNVTLMRKISRSVSENTRSTVSPLLVSQLTSRIQNKKKIKQEARKLNRFINSEARIRKKEIMEDLLKDQEFELSGSFVKA
jgi:hypothetical protein